MSVDKSPARVRRMFDQIVPAYDRLNRLLSFRLDLQWRRHAARQAGPGRVLDLCAGTGDMAAAVGIDRCVAADFSRKMLRRAGIKHPRLARAAADALALPFRDASFHACTVAFGVRNFADLDRGLAEIRRVLRPGGVLVVLELFPPPGRPLARGIARLVPFVGRVLAPGPIEAYRYLAESIGEFLTPESLAARLTAAGFAPPRVMRFVPGPAAVLAASVSGAGPARSGAPARPRRSSPP